MRDLLSVRSSIAGAPALPRPLAADAGRRLFSAAAKLRPWAPLAPVVALALFLRLYRLDGFVTYYPDSYAQLRAVENALNGTFPVAFLYPPGVALFLAPVFAVFPDALVTMQATIVAAGIALVVVAYVAGVRATNDRRAALVFAVAVAFSSPFVFYSRAALFDVINTLLIALSLLLAPLVVRRGLPVLLPYAVLLFVTITVRYSNPVILPALFLASLGDEPFTARRALDHLRSRPVITVVLVVAALYATYFALSFETLSRFGNSESGSIVDFTTYLPRLGRYAQATLVGYADQVRWQDGLAAASVLALAAVGARRLWQTNRRFVIVIAALMLPWLPVHAVYGTFQGRYAMPPFFFVLLLATFGLSVSITWWRSLELPWQRVASSGLLAVAVSLFAGQQLALDAAFLIRWPDVVADGREEAYGDARAFLRGLDGPNSILLSSQALAVDRANPELTTYDLIEHSERLGINDDSISGLVAYVREQRAAGKTVYYHYTEFEEVRSRFRKYELSFYDYFATLSRTFSVRLLVASPSETLTQRIYVIEPATSS